MLKVDGLTIKFGGLIAVNDVSLVIEANKITALIGPNGAGKTTFFNCVSGFHTPTSGTIVFNGQHLEKLHGYQINKAGIARTYQVINLFRKMTVLENVLVGMHSRLDSNFVASLFRSKSQRAEEKKAVAKAHEWLEFVGLQDKAFDRADSLSYGEQRLLEIIRGLASSPSIILLDEPVAGMNAKEKADFDQTLQKILKLGVTIFMIEHDMKLIMGIADKIFVLNNGKLMASGTPKEIQNNAEVIAAYLGEEEI